MLLLEEIIAVSDEDLEIVSDLVAGFSDDKNFVVKLETDEYGVRCRSRRKVWAIVEKEDALMLADYLKVKLTALPLEFQKRFGDSSGSLANSYVEAEFKEILDFILDCGVHYQLVTK